MENLDLKEFYEHDFDFNNQWKNYYTDWLFAFKRAIMRRAEDNCFIGLSSGYDSGAVTKEMTIQKINFKAYVMYNHENVDVIDKRLEYIPEYKKCVMSDSLWKSYYDFLNGKINDVALADKASMGVAYMFETARDEKRTVCISGQGADEIISDYALFPKQSTFKGKFPKKLYEWPNFKEHMQREYTNEIEEIAALYDIDVRYPFLDVDLVQEFLWLDVKLKNKNYKAPLYEYLKEHYVPFEENVKRGFRPIGR